MKIPSPLASRVILRFISHYLFNKCLTIILFRNKFCCNFNSIIWFKVSANSSWNFRLYNRFDVIRNKTLKFLIVSIICSSIKISANLKKQVTFYLDFPHVEGLCQSNRYKGQIAQAFYNLKVKLLSSFYLLYNYKFLFKIINICKIWF